MDNKGQSLDWGEYERNRVPLSQPLHMKHETWALVYSNYDYDQANSLVDNLRKASGIFGIKVEEPQYVECPKNRTSEDYVGPIMSDINPKYT